MYRIRRWKNCLVENLTRQPMKSERNLNRKLVSIIAIDVTDNLFLHCRRTKEAIVPVCEKFKDQVLDCYHSNTGRPLNCSTEAKEYFKCVEQARQVRGRQSNSLYKLFSLLLTLLQTILQSATSGEWMYCTPYWLYCIYAMTSSLNHQSNHHWHCSGLTWHCILTSNVLVDAT